MKSETKDAEPLPLPTWNQLFKKDDKRQEENKAVENSLKVSGESTLPLPDMQEYIAMFTSERRQSQ